MNYKKENKVLSFVCMTVGVVLLTVGVYFFKIPNGFSTGGVSGIGTLLGKITSLTPGMWITIINVLLLLVGFVFLGKETGVKTVYCSLLFSLLTWVLESVVQLPGPVTDQKLLELIYAMLLTSIGSALIFNFGASSGGTDIVALILKKYSKMDVGKALLCTDFIIASCSFFVFDVQTGLFSLLGLFAKAFIVDGVIENLNTCKYFIVITTEYETIAQYIINELHHSATINDAVGEYTQSEKKMIHTVCRRIEALKLKEKVTEVDSNAFIIITTSSEIIGRGFRGV